MRAAGLTFPVGAQVREAGRAAEWAFATFLVLVFVGLHPFKERDFVYLSQLATGEGDLARQVAYVITFATLSFLSLQIRGQHILNAVPRSIAIAVLWLILSASWSIAPEITLRRSGLTAIVAASVFLSVDMLGSDRTLRILRIVLAGVLITNFLSIAFLPHAVHQPGEPDTGLVGAWRGLYFEKNAAGAVSAISAFLFLYFARKSRKLIDWVLFVGSLVFLVGTFSKTAIGLAALTFVVYISRNYTMRNRAWRKLFVGVVLMLMLMAAFSFFISDDQVMEFLNDPTIFTNRGYIWRIVMTAVTERPILGFGFRAFWQSSGSPVYTLASDLWLLNRGHSHNGYLEILVTTGAIGLLLCLIACVFVPMNYLLFVRTPHADLLFTWVFYNLVANLLEVSLFERDRPEWIIFLISLAVMNSAKSGGLRRRKVFFPSPIDREQFAGRPIRKSNVEF